ncbi:GNAT family N-acetyltransferase [Pseudosulfitobacter sp. SM2401]|uniref:GNAT family N-acetyltransferase n=1 Tax=Pseudosulfitobacter sp. SM2401 TaxID=3350098 RepID=UPI0036F2F4D1
MDPLALTEVSADAGDVRALLQRHFDLMRATSPEESCRVMAPDTVADAGVVMLGLRKAGVLLAIGAFKTIAPRHGELKSMHTAAEARGQGAARKILDALLARAKQDGLSRMSLETGTAPEFTAARALYATYGFENCAPFGDYALDPHSTFMTRLI